MTGNEAGGMESTAIETLYARTLYRLRESRKALLKQYGAGSESELLDKIRASEVHEHPAYEHYLGALIIEQAREQLRQELMVRLGGKTADEVPDVSVHLMLKEKLEEVYASRMSEPLRLAQDALLLSFETGLMMEVRYFSGHEFSLHWTWGEAEARIDTAPVHTGLAGFSVHLHRDDGTVAEDPIGLHDAEPWDALSRLLEILLVDPLLERP